MRTPLSFSFITFLFVVQLSCNSKTQEQVLTEIEKDSIPTTRISLLFAGDLMQHQGQIDAARVTNGYDYSSYFKYVKEEIGDADLAIGNLEVTLAGKPYKGYPAFSAPDEYLTAIQDAGFDVLTTANNHCLDRGKKGLERTIRLLDSLKILHAGTYINSEERDKQYPLILEKNGFRIALLNYTYGTNGIPVTSPNIVNYIDTTIIAKDILASKEKSPDIIIACMHWGIEYESLPNKEQTALTEWLLQKGVTHVIGSHPHVIQPIEIRKDLLTDNKHVVVYSLGNFISNMSARRTDGGLMVKLELTKDTTVQMENCTYSLVWTARPTRTGWKNHTLLPVNLPEDSLSIYARNSLRIFTNESRSLLKKYNKGIKEYLFYKKNP